MTRRPPRLLIEFELERTQGRVWLLAETYEDDFRLRLWLRRSGVFAVLAELVEWLLDDLDQHEDAV